MYMPLFIQGKNSKKKPTIASNLDNLKILKCIKMVSMAKVF